MKTFDPSCFSANVRLDTELYVEMGMAALYLSYMCYLQ